MRKIRLESETLRVESFTSDNVSLDLGGTVNAHGLVTQTCPPTRQNTDPCNCTYVCV